MPLPTFVRQFARCLGAAAAAVALFSCVANADTNAEKASIFPAADQKLDNATGGMGGYTMTANGITDYWSTVKSGTITMVVFVFPGAIVTQDIALTVFAPDGKTQIYTYTFKAQKMTVVGSWFTFPANGDYSQTGTYTAVVTASGTEIGRIPLVLAPATQ